MVISPGTGINIIFHQYYLQLLSSYFPRSQLTRCTGSWSGTLSRLKVPPHHHAFPKQITQQATIIAGKEVARPTAFSNPESKSINFDRVTGKLRAR